MSNTIASSLDPTIVSARVSDAGMYGYPIFGSLVDVDYATGSKLTMDMAESLTSTDNVVWTLVLRDGLKFTDGELYDATAVKFNWDRFLAKGVQQSIGSGLIQSTEVVDPKTLKITLKSAQASWPFVLGPLNFIGSPKAITAEGDGFGTKPVGAGPFTLKEFITDTSMTFEKNPDYFQPGKPYLDELTIINQPDAGRRVDALLAGEADIVLGKSDASAQMKSAGFAQFASPNNPSYGGSGWDLNTAKAPFDDKSVRCALIQSIDMDAMNAQLAANATIGPDGGGVWRNFVHRGDAANGAKNVPAFDHDAAQAAFDAYAAKTGHPVEFTLTAINSSTVESEYYITQWSTYKNLKVTEDVKTVPETVGLVGSGSYQIAQLGWGSGDVPAAFSISQFGHSKPDGTANPWTGYTSKEFDAAIDTATHTADATERANALRTAQDVITTECLYNPTVRAALGWPFGKDAIKGWELANVSTKWENVWLDQ
jgi:peptide/nickel transport system substrate-binding protein